VHGNVNEVRKNKTSMKCSFYCFIRSNIFYNFVERNCEKLFIYNDFKLLLNKYRKLIMTTENIYGCSSYTNIVLTLIMLIKKYIYFLFFFST